MAPQNKRTAAATKAPVVAKKAKVAAAPEPEDPLTVQLGSVLSALEASDLPADCCEIFRAALPHCLAETPADRHRFQNQMLDLATSALKQMQEAGRAALEAAETKANNLRAEGAVATADFEAAQRLATAKQQESDAKAKEVERLKGERLDLKVALDDEVKAKEAFLAGKAELIASEEAFQKVIDEMWQPLKGSQFSGQQWRKRDKVLAELLEKLRPLSLDESLCEALQAALKLRSEQRGGFAQRAFDCAEEAFEKHKALLAERVAGAATEEQAREQAVVDAEAKLGEMQSKFAEQDKEYDELQNGWAELETNSNKAKSTATAFESDIQDAVSEVEDRKSDLEAAIAVAASFSALMDPPAPAAAPSPAKAPEAEDIPEPAAEGVVSMEAETEAAVAIAA